MCIVEKDAVIRIRKSMEVVILDAGEVEFIEQTEGVLHMDIVISDTVHDQKPYIFLHGLYVGDGRGFVTVRVMLWGVHVTFCVDRICGENEEFLIRKAWIGGECGI